MVLAFEIDSDNYIRWLMSISKSTRRSLWFYDEAFVPNVWLNIRL